MSGLLRLHPRRFRALALTGMLAAGAACSQNPAGPDADMAFLIGDWAATELRLRNTANPDAVIDLIELGGSFTLNVQPSGQYTAALAVAGALPGPELGTLEVEGDEIIFHRQVPTPETQRAQFRYAGGVLTLEGETQIDVNSDGVPEEALLETTLVRN